MKTAWRPALLLALVAAAIGNLGLFLVHWPQGFASDFRVFWQASSSLHPYAPSATPFANAPPSLLLLRPFGTVPMWLGYALLSVLGIAAFAYFSRRLYGASSTLLGMLSPAILSCLIAGQLSLAVGALILAAFSTAWTGPLLAVAIVLKPQMAFLAPILLRPRQLALLAATGLALSATATLVYGFAIWIDWIGGMANLLSVAQRRGALNLSVAPNSYVPVLPLFIALASYVLYRCRSAGPPQQAAALVASSLFASPYALSYDLAPVAPFAAAMILRHNSFGAALTHSAALGPLSLVSLVPALLRRSPRPPESSAELPTAHEL